MSPAFRQFAPPPDLALVIDACWINLPGDDGPDASRPENRILPDGCIDLIVRGPEARGEPARLFTSALIEEAEVIGPGAPSWFAGVRFRPAMAQVVLDVPPVECRDRDLRAVEVDATFGELEDRLASCASPTEALALLRQDIERRARANLHRRAPRHVQQALAELAIVGDGRAPRRIRDVAHTVGIDERHLHRELVRWSGLAPKVLARIFRMRAAVARLQADGGPLALVAQDLGYADQAHLTRELRRLTGLAPSRFRDVRNVQDRLRARR